MALSDEEPLIWVTQRIAGTDNTRRFLGTVTYDPDRDRYLALSAHFSHCPPTVFYDLRRAVLWVVREDLRHFERD